MADTYYDATGVLTLDRVTPVITALFGAFALDESYPGNGRVYIAKLSGRNDPQWDGIRDALAELAAHLGLSALAESSPDIKVLLKQLAGHFHAGNETVLNELIDSGHFEDEADLQVLFEIAACLDDGHGLRAIEIEGCWRCSRPVLFEFGGDGLFVSREITLHGSSSQALELGQALYDALATGHLDEATRVLATHAAGALIGIHDGAIREALRRRLARRLLEDDVPTLLT